MDPKAQAYAQMSTPPQQKTRILWVVLPVIAILALLSAGGALIYFNQIKLPSISLFKEPEESESSLNIGIELPCPISANPCPAATRQLNAVDPKVVELKYQPTSGTPIVAVIDGTMKRFDVNESTGTYVVTIENGNLRVGYFIPSGVIIQDRPAVTKGEVLGNFVNDSEADNLRIYVSDTSVGGHFLDLEATDKGIKTGKHYYPPEPKE